MGDAWRVVERLLAGVVVGLAVGLVAAWVGLGIAGVVLGPHRVGEGRLPRRPAPVAPFPRPADGSFALPGPVVWGPERMSPGRPG